MCAIGIKRLSLGGIGALAAAAALATASGCGVENSAGGPASSSPSGDEPVISRRPEKRPRRDTVVPSHCSSELPSCRTTKGLIVYVERVDPDGDGDAHFVVVDPQGITLPGLTAIDVRKGLRPHPLPGAGDLISAAGPVQTGSYGQSQIHALELHVAR
jgi:hypothetical protein